MAQETTPGKEFKKAKTRIWAAIAWSALWTFVIIFTEASVGGSSRGGPLFSLGLFLLTPGAMTLFLLAAKWARQADPGYAVRVATNVSVYWFAFFLLFSVIVSASAPYWWVFLAEFFAVVLPVPGALMLHRILSAQRIKVGPRITSATSLPAASADPRYCPSCGAAIPQNTSFCRQCGTNLKTGASPQSSTAAPQSEAKPTPAVSVASTMESPAPTGVPSDPRSRLKTLLSKEPRIYADDIKTEIASGSKEQASRLIEEKFKLLNERARLASSIKGLDQQRSNLTSMLASGKLDAESYRLAREDLEVQRNEAQERLAQIDARLYKEEYEKPVF